MIIAAAMATVSISYLVAFTGSTTAQTRRPQVQLAAEAEAADSGVLSLGHVRQLAASHGNASYSLDAPAASAVRITLTWRGQHADAPHQTDRNEQTIKFREDLQAGGRTIHNAAVFVPALLAEPPRPTTSRRSNDAVRPAGQPPVGRTAGHPHTPASIEGDPRAYRPPPTPSRPSSPQRAYRRPGAVYPSPT